MAVGIPAGQSLASKASEAFMDWMRKAAYNITARSGGVAGMMGEGGAGLLEYSLGELMAMATTPIHEKEVPYSGGQSGALSIGEFKGREFKSFSYQGHSEEEIMEMLEDFKQQVALEPDLLGFFLKQKTMDEANLTETTARPTEISQRFKDLPTVTIKEHTDVVPISDTYRWSDKMLQKLKNLKKGEVIKFSEEDKRVGNVGIYPRLDIGSYTLSAGKDDQGTYISLFDVWDFGKGYVEKYLGEESILAQMQAPLMQAVGQPFAIYDRYYIPETDLQMELENRERLAHLLSPMPVGTYSSISEALWGKIKAK